jgi:hypothetical protein
MSELLTLTDIVTNPLVYIPAGLSIPFIFLMAKKLERKNRGKDKRPKVKGSKMKHNGKLR